MCTVKIHSMVDLITNSSTELFCVVIANSEQNVQEVIDSIIAECGCKILEEIYVEPYIDLDEDSPTYDKEIEGKFNIMYEQHAPPCNLIMNKIKETFEIIIEIDE